MICKYTRDKSTYICRRIHFKNCIYGNNNQTTERYTTEMIQNYNPCKNVDAISRSENILRLYSQLSVLLQTPIIVYTQSASISVDYAHSHARLRNLGLSVLDHRNLAEVAIYASIYARLRQPGSKLLTMRFCAAYC